MPNNDVPFPMVNLDANPREANWYWEVIYKISNPETNTDYAYGYSIEDPTETIEYLWLKDDIIELKVSPIERAPNEEYKPPHLSPYITYTNEDPLVTGKFFN